jgi:hypothetical protein
MTAPLRASIVALLVGFAGTACTTTRAATPVERPALEVPPPPPRVVAPQPAPQPQLEPVENIGPGTPIPSVPKTRPQRDNSTQKPDPKPEEPKPVDPIPVAPPAQEPAAAPQLRLPENSGSPQVSQITDTIGRAKYILSKVNFEPLSPAAKKAYKESEMFADQALDALKNNNLALAREFADKAERLAKGLQGR